jgi:hypothetical protein
MVSRSQCKEALQIQLSGVEIEIQDGRFVVAAARPIGMQSNRRMEIGVRASDRRDGKITAVPI